jgi:hypothetical protein
MCLVPIEEIGQKGAAKLCRVPTAGVIISKEWKMGSGNCNKVIKYFFLLLSFRFISMISTL